MGIVTVPVARTLDDAGAAYIIQHSEVVSLRDVAVVVCFDVFLSFLWVPELPRGVQCRDCCHGSGSMRAVPKGK